MLELSSTLGSLPHSSTSLAQPWMSKLGAATALLTCHNCKAGMQAHVHRQKHRSQKHSVALHRRQGRPCL